MVWKPIRPFLGVCRFWQFLCDLRIGVELASKPATIPAHLTNGYGLTARQRTSLGLRKISSISSVKIFLSFYEKRKHTF